MYKEGVRTEDFEECERTFCGSNNLANVTRLATPFHQQQEIQEYFSFHDEDKQTNIGQKPINLSRLSFNEHSIYFQDNFSSKITVMLVIGSGMENLN